MENTTTYDDTMYATYSDDSDQDIIAETEQELEQEQELEEEVVVTADDTSPVVEYVIEPVVDSTVTVTIECTDDVLETELETELDTDMTSDFLLKLCPQSDSVAALYADNNSVCHEGDSGFDLFFPEDVSFSPGETKLVDLKVRSEMFNCKSNKSSSYYLYARSSISKTPLVVANNQGIIDAGYRGNLKVALKYVPTDKFLLACSKATPATYTKFVAQNMYKVKRGDKLVQLCAPTLETPTVEFVDSLSDSSRGAGGFGSTN
jgi:dUTP pyrophosphatase